MRSASKRTEVISRLWDNKTTTMPVPSEGEPPKDWNESKAIKAILDDMIW